MLLKMIILRHLLLLISATQATFYDDKDDENGLKDKNFEKLYNIAKDSYLANDWKNCVRYMEQSLRDFRSYHDVVTQCKRRCRKAATTSKKLSERNIDGMHFYEEIVRNTLCFMKCKKQAFGADRVEEVSDKTLAEFDVKLPYDYLQLCYFQVRRYQDAASSAFTHLVYNPDDENMKENLEYYITHTGAERDELVNYESQPYVSSFLAGTEHYRREEWEEVRARMEEAVVQYIEAEEGCRFACEKPFDMGWFPDFVSSVANHFTFCLRCKQNCSARLSNLNGKYVEDLFPLFYHYLQIAYFNLGNLRKASASVESFLLFHPDDNEMSLNKEFYLKQTGAEENWFSPREEAMEAFERGVYQRKLMEYIESSFTFDDDEKISVALDKAHPESNTTTTGTNKSPAASHPVPPPPLDRTKYDL